MARYHPRPKTNSDRNVESRRWISSPCQPQQDRKFLQGRHSLSRPSATIRPMSIVHNSPLSSYSTKSGHRRTRAHRLYQFHMLASDSPCLSPSISHNQVASVVRSAKLRQPIPRRKRHHHPSQLVNQRKHRQSSSSSIHPFLHLSVSLFNNWQQGRLK